MEETRTNEVSDRPWEGLEDLLDRDASIEVKEFLEELTPADAARCLDRLDQEHRDHVLELLDPESAAELIEHLPEAQGTDLLEHAEP